MAIEKIIESVITEAKIKESASILIETRVNKNNLSCDIELKFNPSSVIKKIISELSATVKKNPNIDYIICHTELIDSGLSSLEDDLESAFPDFEIETENDEYSWTIELTKK